MRVWFDGRHDADAPDPGPCQRPCQHAAILESIALVSFVDGCETAGQHVAQTKRNLLIAGAILHSIGSMKSARRGSRLRILLGGELARVRADIVAHEGKSRAFDLVSKAHAILLRCGAEPRILRVPKLRWMQSISGT